LKDYFQEFKTNKTKKQKEKEGRHTNSQKWKGIITIILSAPNPNSMQMLT